MFYIKSDINRDYFSLQNKDSLQDKKILLLAVNIIQTTHTIDKNKKIPVKTLSL